VTAWVAAMAVGGLGMGAVAKAAGEADGPRQRVRRSS